ncbi:hypothetical protein RAJCM14343_2771 [Rhodococcus aetherivorans]|uniref:Uncharacterized protein n=1 Tax=Rhodococcus aetherivorans TaxID=191292 RepID=A0ABQ0YM12_9NOCA|nr:hypothetical protein RAJCM14343_2771 [Rhodococcus aetherivorans]
MLRTGPVGRDRGHENSVCVRGRVFAGAGRPRRSDNDE